MSNQSHLIWEKKVKSNKNFQKTEMYHFQERQDIRKQICDVILCSHFPYQKNEIIAKSLAGQMSSEGHSRFLSYETILN